MAYPEPSRSDHDAPWNVDEYEDPETGESYWVCSCYSCEAARRKYREE